MKLKSYAFLAGIALLATACSHGFYYKPDPATTDQSNTFINSGVTYAVSKKPYTTVVLTALKPAGDQLVLRVAYLNNNFDRADAIPEAIKVLTMTGKKVKQYQVFNAENYLNKLQRKQNFAMAVSAMSSAYNNQQAGYSASSTTAGVVTSNGTYAVGASNTLSYDASKVSEANYRSRQELQQVANGFNQSNQSLSQQLIRSNTLMKGQSMEGLVVVNTGKSFGETIYVEVPFAGESHAFTLVPNK